MDISSNEDRISYQNSLKEFLLSVLSDVFCPMPFILIWSKESAAAESREEMLLYLECTVIIQKLELNLY